MTKNFLFISHPDFTFCELFPRPLGGLKIVSEDVFGHTDSTGSF